LSTALRRNLRRITLMRRVVSSIEYGLLAVGAAIVAFGVVIALGEPPAGHQIAGKPSKQPTIIEPAIIETVPAEPAPQDIAGRPTDPDTVGALGDPETVGGISDLGLRR
jgi:hypothetical protein